MRRSVGHKVGLTFYAASIGTIGAMLAKPEWSKTPLRFLLAGGALAGIGYYFRNTLYLNDPEAVAEYRKEIESIAFSQAMKKYSLDDLIKLLDTNTLRTYYEREMNNSCNNNANNNNKTGHHHQYLDISVAIERFSIEGLKKLLSTGIVPLDDLKMRFDCLVNSSANFTALWQKLGVSSFNELRQMTVLKAETCRQLFMREFWYVTPDGQDQTMIGRPAGYTSTAGAPLGLIRALTQYGEVASQLFGVSKEFFQGAIEHSKYGRKVTLAELLAEGLLGLEERGYVRAEFVDRKLRETMYGKSGADGDSGMHSRTTSCASSNGSETNNNSNNKERFLAESNNNNKNNNNNTNTNGGSITPPKSRITLWQAEDQLRLKELLDRKLVFIPTVAPLFHDAVPTKYFTNNQSPSKMNNVVLFYEHWEKYLVANPSLIPPMYRMTINSMSRQAARAKKEKEDALYKAKTDLEKIAGKTIVAELDNLKALAKTELNQKSKQRREQLIEVTTNAKHAYDKAKKAAEENYQRTIIELHKDFCASVLEMKSNQ